MTDTGQLDVVTCVPAGQSVTVGAHEVTVITLVDQMVLLTISGGLEVGNTPVKEMLGPVIIMPGLDVVKTPIGDKTPVLLALELALEGQVALPKGMVRVEIWILLL